VVTETIISLTKKTFSNDETHHINQKFLCVDQSYMTLKDVDDFNDDSSDHEHSCSTTGDYWHEFKLKATNCWLEDYWITYRLYFEI